MVKKVLNESATLKSTEVGESASESTNSNAYPVDESTPNAIQNPDDVLNPIVTNYDGFDPNAHAVNADGTPRMKSTGGYAAKRGRKPGQTSAIKKGSPIVSMGVADLGAQNEATAKLCANILINGGVQVFGDHWKPTDKAEAEGLKCAFKDYFDSIGGVNLPPSVALIIAVGMYSAPRVMHPDSQAKIQLWTGKIKKQAL
jgi:hypothetical protein